jgi:hypothetical protein
MVNAQAKTRALREALINQNASQIAETLELPPIALSSSPSTSPNEHKIQSLVVDGVEYGSLVALLLDATAAAEVVSPAACFIDGAIVSWTCNHNFFDF